MAFFEEDKDNIMHECRKEDPFTWESSVRLTLVGNNEDIGMFLEERDGGRKRKWHGEGKIMRREDGEEREQRRMPPKKVMATLGDMGGSGTSSSSSHLSPGWPTNELDLELTGELSAMSEALLSLPPLPVFKQEALSPPGNALSTSRRAWAARKTDERQITNMMVDNHDMEEGCQQPSPHSGVLMNTHSSPEGMQCQPMPVVVPLNGYHSPTNHENKNTGLLMCTTSSLDGFLQPSAPRSDDKDDDTRFQYVLAAATSIATKQTEESLTYLNQGQPYEIKLKKLGDLAQYQGKVLKSVIKICFHERRLQYMERAQMSQWHAERPGERIIEVDVPLSYGVIRVEQPSCLNALNIYWNPTQDVGVYIKVNCISTEFTPKKHGGEKGVPFRIQVETYFANEENRLHAAACQIKVFKLKGADRKHKQDREKVLRRPPNSHEKYQAGCDATVLSPLPNDALLPPPSLVTSPPYSPEMCVTPKATSPKLVTKPVLSQPAILTTNQMKPLYFQDGGDIKADSPPYICPDLAILPDLPQPAEDPDRNSGLSKDATASETQAWLTRHRFTQHTATFTNFSGADLLRLTRDEVIQICGLADGIRLFNALQAKRIEPRLTVYVCPAGHAVYSALYLHACKAIELVGKLRAILPASAKECSTVVVSGPNGASVRLTDELVRHLPDKSTYHLERIEEDTLLLSPTIN